MNIKITVIILVILSSLMIVDGSASAPIPTYIPNFSPVPTIPADPVISVNFEGVNTTMVVSTPSPVRYTTYRSFVTDGLGFYRIRNVEVPPVPFTYEDRILNINSGDTILWINDADAATITIVSDQNLWDDKVGQIKVGATINYKFDSPGTYTFHVKGTSMRQTIIVGGMGYEPTVEPTDTYTPSPTVAEDMSTPTPSPIPTGTQSKAKTSAPTPITTLPQIVNTTNDANNNTPVQASVPIDLPIRITATTIASVIVVMFSLYMTHKTGKK
jgi:plastocyanin